MTTALATLQKTQAVILAGAQGERLSPLTTSRPKPAVPFAGMFRIIDFTLSNCFHSKLNQVSLLTQYRYQDLHAYIDSGWNELWKENRGGRTLACLPPANGKRYRGTADAVLQNLGELRSNRSRFVLILAADHIYRDNAENRPQSPKWIRPLEVAMRNEVVAAAPIQESRKRSAVAL